MAPSFDGKRVSSDWFAVLSAARRDGLAFRLNSGQRTMAEQQRLRDMFEAGIGNLAAVPSPTAPHIRVGRQDHALDIDMHVGVGTQGVMRWLDQHGVPTTLTVPGEGWHIEANSAAQLHAAARRLAKPLTVLDRLRALPIRRGRKSPDVRTVQVYLKRGGYWHGKPAKKTGTAGPELIAAVRAFQRHVGLPVDGIVGPKTFAALRRRYGARVWLRRAQPKPRPAPAARRPQQISTVGLELIQSFEGLPNAGRPYNDPVGHATVGFGHLLHFGPVTDNDRNDVWLDGQKTPGRLTRAEALKLLRRDLERGYEPAVRQLGVPLSQNQYDALVSFVFNVGTGAIAPSTGVGRALRDRRYQDAANELLRWDKAGNPPKPLAGLTRRRRAERALFLKETR